MPEIEGCGRVRVIDRAMLAVVMSCAFAFGCASQSGHENETAPVAVAPATSALPQSAVDAPALKVGDVWVDRIGGKNREFKIDSEHDGLFDVSFWGTQMTTDQNLNVLIYRSLTEEGSPPSKLDEPDAWFGFPFYPGKIWNETYTWRTLETAPITGTSNLTGKVIGWEEVAVPAGKFRTLKVEVARRSFGKGGMHDEMNMTYWYAPEVRRFVKLDYYSNWEGTVQTELVSYKLAGAR
jgi:hypothetical protein